MCIFMSVLVYERVGMGMWVCVCGRRMGVYMHVYRAVHAHVYISVHVRVYVYVY